MLALVTLPFQPRESAEFVVTVLSAIVSGAFVVGVALLARSADPPPPHDNERRTGYNERPDRRDQ